MPLLDHQVVIESMCARGFLRQVTLLALTSKEVASICPMGTGRQVHDAARDGNAPALTTFIQYWQDNKESRLVLDWSPPRYLGESTPLVAAAARNRVSCVELLASTSPAVDVNAGRGAALYAACVGGFAAVVRILTAVPNIHVNEQQMPDGCRPLHVAALYGHADVVHLLVAVKGIDLNGINCNGKSPIDLAMQEQHQEVTAILVEAIAAKKALHAAGRQVFKAAEVGDVSKLGPLLKTWTGNQVVLNWELKEDDEDDEGNWLDGTSPLMAASVEGHADAVQMMVNTAGVDVNKAGDDGWTALICAADYGRPNVVRVLVAAPGIDIDMRATGENFYGKSALGIAMSANETDDQATRAGKKECAALLRAAAGEIVPDPRTVLLEGDGVWSCGQRGQRGGRVFQFQGDGTVVDVNTKDSARWEIEPSFYYGAYEDNAPNAFFEYPRPACGLRSLLPDERK